MENATDPQLRPLEPGEWPLLRAMRIRAATLHPDLFYDTPQTAESHPASHWQNLLNGDGNKFWGLFDKDRCVGLTGIVTEAKDPSGQTAMIGYSFLEPEYRGRGFADLFYKVRLAQAVEHVKWKKVETDHRIGNEPSRKAITRHGFVLTEKAMVDWPDGSRDYELRYELDLEKLRTAPSAPNGAKNAIPLAKILL